MEVITLDLGHIKRKYYISPDKYIYIANQVRDITYFRCIHQRSRNQPPCNATASGTIITDSRHDSDYVINVGYRNEHTHKPELAELHNLRLRRICYERSVTEAETLETIYTEELANFPQGNVCFANLRRGMLKRRSTSLPRNAITLNDFKNILENSPRFRLKAANEPFYRYSRINEAGSFFIFIPDGMLPLLKTDRCHIDGTFRCVPKIFHRLLRIHILQHGHPVPALYVLMTRNVEELYVELFQFLNKEYGFNPSQILIDFEMDSLPFIRAAFPTAEVKGCLFHYCQDINQPCEENNDLGVRLQNLSPNLSSFFRLLSTLPVQPEQPILAEVEAEQIIVKVECFNDASYDGIENNIDDRNSNDQNTSPNKMSEILVKIETLNDNVPHDNTDDRNSNDHNPVPNKMSEIWVKTEPVEDGPCDDIDGISSYSNCEQLDKISDNSAHGMQQLLMQENSEEEYPERIDQPSNDEEYLLTSVQPSSKVEKLKKTFVKKSYSCKFCPYKTTHRGHFNSHGLKHSSELPFPCHFCNYRANQKATLKRHMIRHSGEKPFSCHLCKYATNRKNSLKVHLFSHSDKTPFSCDLCEYTTNRKNGLKFHLLTHSEKKPFSCNVCQYSSELYSSLKDHMLKHRG